MKPEAKKIERPLEKDYFEYRGKQIIIDYGHATNFIDAQNEYCDQLEQERDELKGERGQIMEVANNAMEEIQTLKDEVKELLKYAGKPYLYYVDEQKMDKSINKLKTLTK